MSKDYNKVKEMFNALPIKSQEEFLKIENMPTATHLPQIEEQKNGTMTRWDLFSRLLSERIVRLDGQVDGGMSAVAQASLQYLDSLNNKPIRMIINSPGGSVMDGLAIYDTMREIRSPVHTQGYGMMASMGSLLLVGGDKRSMSKNSSIMIHSIGSKTEGKFLDMEADIHNTKRLYKMLVDIYVAHTGVEEQFWYDALLSRDNWITSEDAETLNIVDEILPYHKTAPFEHLVNHTGTTNRKTFNEVSADAIKKAGAQRLKATPIAGNDNETALKSHPRREDERKTVVAPAASKKNKQGRNM